jgi:predicted transcriptional regulator
MSKPTTPSTVLTLRVSRDTERRLSREARRRRRTRSDLAREILVAGLADAHHEDARAEARRQSALATAHGANDDVVAFIAAAADLKGWK